MCNIIHWPLLSVALPKLFSNELNFHYCKNVIVREAISFQKKEGMYIRSESKNKSIIVRTLIQFVQFQLPNTLMFSKCMIFLKLLLLNIEMKSHEIFDRYIASGIKIYLERCESHLILNCWKQHPPWHCNIALYYKTFKQDIRIMAPR